MVGGYMNNPNNNIVQTIKMLCKEEQIKLSDLEIQSDLSKGAISRWKNELPKSITSLIKISQILNVSTDYLLGIDNSRSSSDNNSIIELIISKTIKYEIEWEKISYSKLKNDPLNIIHKKFFDSYITYTTQIKDKKIIFIYTDEGYFGYNYYLLLNNNGEYIPINYRESQINKLFNLIINQRKKAIIDLLEDLQE